MIKIVFSGRKLPLLLTLFGLIFYILTQLISIITYDSILIYYWMMVGEFGFGLTGGYAAVFAAPFAIVIDDSRSQMHQVCVITHIYTIGPQMCTIFCRQVHRFHCVSV